MGKPKAPKAPDPYQTAGADFGYNNLNQTTPYGSLEFMAPVFQNIGSNRNPFYQVSQPGSANLTLSPEIQALLDKQIKVSGITLDQALARQGELSNLGPLPTPDRDAYSKQLFEGMRGLLDPVFQEQERSLRGMLSNQGLPTGSEAYGYDVGMFTDKKNDAYRDASRDAFLGAGDLMGQEISNSAALRAIPFNEIASLLGIQQVQPPGLNQFYAPRGADFTGAQALQSGMQQQNYQNQMSGFSDMLGGLFGLGGAAIRRWG